MDVLSKLEGQVPQLQEALGEVVKVQKDWGRNWARLYVEKGEGQFTDELKEWAVEKMVIMMNSLQSALDQIE